MQSYYFFSAHFTKTLPFLQKNEKDYFTKTLPFLQKNEKDLIILHDISMLWLLKEKNLGLTLTKC